MPANAGTSRGIVRMDCKVERVEGRAPLHSARSTHADDLP